MAGIAIRDPSGTAFAWLRPRPTAAQGSLVADRIAGVRKGTHEVLPGRSAGQLQAPTLGATREVPLESRARLSATEGGTGARSLGGEKLDRLAPPHDAGHAGSRIPDTGNAPQQKNFWVDPPTDAS